MIVWRKLTVITFHSTADEQRRRRAARRPRGHDDDEADDGDRARRRRPRASWPSDGPDPMPPGDRGRRPAADHAADGSAPCVSDGELGGRRVEHLLGEEHDERPGLTLPSRFISAEHDRQRPQQRRGATASGSPRAARRATAGGRRRRRAGWRGGVADDRRRRAPADTANVAGVEDERQGEARRPAGGEPSGGPRNWLATSLGRVQPPVGLLQVAGASTIAGMNVWALLSYSTSPMPSSSVATSTTR